METTTVVFSERLGLFRCEVVARNEQRALIRLDGVQRALSVPACDVFELAPGQTLRGGVILDCEHDQRHDEGV
jgi:hypothetical protein